jgi:hypothetical protein
LHRSQFRNIRTLLHPPITYYIRAFLQLTRSALRPEPSILFAAGNYHFSPDRFKNRNASGTASAPSSSPLLSPLRNPSSTRTSLFLSSLSTSLFLTVFLPGEWLINRSFYRGNAEISLFLSLSLRRGVLFRGKKTEKKGWCGPHNRLRMLISIPSSL